MFRFSKKRILFGKVWIWRKQKEKLERRKTDERLFLDEELRLPSLAKEMNLYLHCPSALLN
ncbi:hypothetical protein CH380_09780 [Leptospira adleri]|uniref:Uncharacterized protein n=1 Tax=Leptospira adleri TaxID=2023186 RepID=A0A2M9YPL4_9LEPT|nr:hypothetical protein CH380_09780 [Leptospira adleri]PJZ63050.1 hypothetical protein CH376_05140 [Leptospira adleri]